MATTPLRFKVKSDVTLPLLKIVQDRDYFVTFNGAMSLGKKMAVKKTVDEKTGEIVDAPQREAATIAPVTNLETGEHAQIICGTVFRKELADAYPENGYVGKSFKFRIAKVSGKNYNIVQISEIEIETETEDEPAPEDTPKAKPKK